MPSLKVVRNVVDRMKSLSNFIVVSVNNSGEMRLRVETDLATVTTYFRDLRTPITTSGKSNRILILLALRQLSVYLSLPHCLWSGIVRGCWLSCILVLTTRQHMASVVLSLASCLTTSVDWSFPCLKYYPNNFKLREISWRKTDKCLAKMHLCNVLELVYCNLNGVDVYRRREQQTPFFMKQKWY